MNTTWFLICKSIQWFSYPYWQKTKTSHIILSIILVTKNNPKSILLFIIALSMFLGIDPGVRKLWYAVIDTVWGHIHICEAGVIVDLDNHMIDRVVYWSRINEIYLFIQQLLTQYHIDAMAIEKLFFTKFNQNNAEFVYAVRWMICMLAYQKNISIFEPTPIQLKKAISGNAKADKKTMIAMIMRLYELVETLEYHDSADALWLALYACRLHKFH